jgi:peptide/nickel transport system substrate-binding protein
MFRISSLKRPAVASRFTLSAHALSVALAASPPANAETITAVMHSDLRVIDPGFMVYDTLLAEDANFKIQPQMADWKVSDDKFTYTFTLRDGLKVA